MMMSLSAARRRISVMKQCCHSLHFWPRQVSARASSLCQRALASGSSKFSAVACVGRLFPCGDGAVVFDLFQTAKHGLIREIEKLFAAEIVVAPLHVAD